MFRREKVYIMFYFFMLDMEIFTSDESGYVPAITKKRNWREIGGFLILQVPETPVLNAVIHEKVCKTCKNV